MEKLNCESLMIGDWVLTLDSTHEKKVFAQADAIEEGKRSILVTRECSNWFVDIDWIEPVSLTPEILEKNSFVANKHVYPYPYYEYEVKESKVKVGFAFPQGNKTSYKEPWVCIDTECAYIEHLPCMFVHQLQHALRLCGITREIIV